MGSNIYPAKNRILVTPISPEVERIMDSGLVTANFRTDHKWTVVAIGAEVSEVAIGETIYLEWLDYEFEHDGRRYAIASSESILAVIRPTG